MLSSACATGIISGLAYIHEMAPVPALHALDGFYFLLCGPYPCPTDDQAVPNEDVSEVCGVSGDNCIGMCLPGSPPLKWFYSSCFANHVLL